MSWAPMRIWRAVPGELQLFGGPSRNIDKFIWNGLSVQGLNSRLSCWLPALTWRSAKALRRPPGSKKQLRASRLVRAAVCRVGDGSRHTRRAQVLGFPQIGRAHL